MREAIADTGPLLHLAEIRRLEALGVCGHLLIPTGVRDELGKYRLWVELEKLKQPGIEVREADQETMQSRRDLEDGRLQRADIEVLELARSEELRHPVLTDDLALRKSVQSLGGMVVGTFGLLLRAYREEILSRNQLTEAVDDLMSKSTLHMSRAFRGYVLSLLPSI